MRSPLYLVEQGSRLSREGRRLVVAKDGQVLAQAPVLQISQVIVFGNSQITTPALRLLLDEGVEVVLLSQTGRFYGRLVGAESGHGALRVAQVLRSRDPAFALATAQAMVHGKLHNLRVFLLRYARRLAAPEVRSAAESMEALLARVPRTTTIPSLMGVEGQATALYFGVWKSLLKVPWRFARRVRRPPTDPVNVLLSLGYTILTQNLLGAVLTAGLDPYVGFLHQLSYNRPSLALDLVEEFRPLIVDSVALRCLNNGIVTEQHFAPGEEEQPIVLTPEGMRLYIRELETRLTQAFKHPESGEQVTYRRLFLLQAYRLAATLRLEPSSAPHTEPQPIYRPFTVR
jgi:CRISPR-associated protein Cas1